MNRSASPYFTDELLSLIIHPEGATAIQLLRGTERTWPEIAAGLASLERHNKIRCVDWYGEERWFSNEVPTIAD